MGEGSIEGTTPFNNAFVIAENFIIGISSSELSFNEYDCACVSAGTESERCNGGLWGLKACREGLRERDPKCEDPMGVGDAAAISRKSGGNDKNYLVRLLIDVLSRRIVQFHSRSPVLPSDRAIARRLSIISR